MAARLSTPITLAISSAWMRWSPSADIAPASTGSAAISPARRTTKSLGRPGSKFRCVSCCRRVKGRMADKVAALLLFGATGDLARRMLLPSLFGLDTDGLLPDGLRIIGTARTALDDAAFRERAAAALKEYFPASSFDEAVAQRFLERLYYVPLDIGDPAGF